jgi:hypothetical protein
VLLALALAACAAPAPASPPSPAAAISSRAVTLADLIAEVQRDGEGAVISDPLASQIGVDDPTTCKVLHYPEGSDKLAHSVYVAQKERIRSGVAAIPQFVIFATRRLSPGVDERRYMRLRPSGKLEQATIVRDKVDSEGGLKEGGRSVESVAGDKAQDWLDHENEYYFNGKYRREAP